MKWKGRVSGFLTPMPLSISLFFVFLSHMLSFNDKKSLELEISFQVLLNSKEEEKNKSKITPNVSQ